MKKHLLIFCIGLLSIMTSLRTSAQTFDWSCFPTSGTILADNNGLANLNLTTANCSVANGWVLQCQGTGEQRILSSALGGNPYIRMQKVGTDAVFSFARLLTASGALFTLKSISVTPTSVGAAAGGNQVITLHAYKGGREQGSTSTGSLGSITLVNIPESQLGAFVNIDEIRFTSDQPAAFGVGIDDVVITTGAVIPTVTTGDPAAVTANSATLSGNVTADGGATVNEKGVVYATTANPTIANTKMTNGTGTGAISVNALGLAGSTTYHVRAYATNSIGTAYGADKAFTTLAANHAPVTVADNYSFSTGVTLTIPAPGILGNDTDADGDPLTAILVSGPANGTLTLNSNGSFIYSSTSTANDQFTYKANDGKVDGNTVTVTLTHINSAPVLTASAGTTVFSGSDAIIDPGITVTDDSGTLASGIVTITGGLHSAEDRLVFTASGATGDITGSYNNLVGILSLQSPSGVATVAQWQAALRSIAYRNLNSPPTANVRTITFSVNDGTLNSNPVSKAVSIALSNINATGTLSALNTTYGTASAPGTFSVLGINLTAGILVTAPTGFEVSVDNATFSPTVTIGSAGNVSSTPVYIRLIAGDNAGTYSGNVVLSSSGASNVNVATAASIVNPKKLTITAKNITKTYGQTLTGGATTTEFTTAGLVGTETIGNVTLAYGTGAAANAGVNTYTGSVTASAANGGTFTPANYAINYVAGDIVVNKAALTITANNKGKAFGTLLTGGPGSVDFTSTGLVGTETIGSVAITYGAGAAVNAAVGAYPGSIVPSAATGGTFSAANYSITYAAGTLTVGQAILTITANSSTKTYGAPVPILTVSYSGFVGTDGPSSLTTLPTISTPVVANSPVNTYPITPSGAVSSNYTIVYQSGTLTVTPAALTVTANNASKIYGATVPLLGVSYSGFVGTDNAGSLITAPTLTTPVVTDSPVGTYPITPSGAVSSNYTFIYKPGVLTVTQAALTITATDQTKTYGQTLTGGAGSTAFTSTGLVGTETIGSVTLAYGTGAAAGAAVNTYTGSIVPSAATGGTFNPANYTISYVAGNITIGKAAITITANAGNKIYGNVDPTLTYAVTTGALVGTDAFTGSLTRVPGENAGIYAIRQGSLALNNNYTLTFVTANFTINKADITVTADPQTKAFGAADPVLTYRITSGRLAFADTFTGALTRAPGESAGTYAILQGTLALSSNYNLTYVGANLSIGKTAITVTADVQTKTYGDVDPVLTYKITSGTLAPGDTFTGSLTRAAGQNVGTYAIQQGTLMLGSNYTLTYVGANLTIGKAAITVTANAQTKAYGAVDPALTFKVTSGLLKLGDTFTGALTRVAGENAGTYAIQQGTLALSSNYNLTYAGANLTIGKAAITVTADAQNKAFGAADPALTYKVTSGALVGTDKFTGALTRAVGENAGIYTIQQGSLALSSNYTLTYVGANLSIGKAAVTVTADAQTKIYGTTDPALTYKITNGALVGTDKFTGTLTRTAGENAGTYAIQQGTLALSSNYTLTYVGANLTIGKAAITVTADAQSKNFGDADPVLTYKITSGGLKFADTFTGSLTRAPGENVGTYAIQQGTLALSSNYTLTYVGANLTIGKTAITVTADAQTKTYGDADPVLTYKITSGALAGKDTFTGSLIRAAGENVGTYAIKQGTLTLGSNYTLTYVGANLTIGKAAITVTADVQTKAYGDVDPTLTYKITTGALKFADTFTGSLTRAAGENAGTYAIQQGSLALSSNYNLTYAGANLTIGKAAITVTADAKTKAYGEADPALTYKITSGALKFADTFTGSLTRAAGENVGTYAIQQGSLALSSNYTLTYTGANLTIGKAAITVTADAKTKIYGEVDPALTYKITTGALVGADKFTGALARVAGENIGTYAIQQGTLALNSNYTLTYIGANLSIGKAAVTITADAQNKIYGTTDPALTYTITSGALVGTDKFTGALTRAAGENVGIYAIQQGGLALSNNYTLTYVGANLSIGKAAIAITANAQSKIYGTVDPALTYSITNGSLVGKDIFTGALARAAGEDVGTYAIQQGTLALNGNYTLTYIGANLTIDKASVTVTADAQNKIYGTIDPTLTYKITTGALVGTDKFTGALTRAAGENVGVYAIQQGSLALNGNYTLTYAGANLTIGKAAITVTANAQNKIYGAADPALTYAVTSGALVGTDKFTGALTRVVGENVGVYAIQQGSLALNSNYTLTYAGANLTIGKAVIAVTAIAQSKVYGTADPALTYAITTGALVGTDKFTGALTRVAGENVGTYAIQQGSLALNSNYTLTYVGANLTITLRTLTITANNASKIYGSANPVLNISYNGFVNGESASNLTTQPAIATTATQSSSAGTYPITVSGAAIANYQIVYIAGTLTINKAMLTITAEDKSRLYGVANPAFTAVYSGFVNGDDQAALTKLPVLATVANSASLPGSYSITASGAVAANYSFNYVSGKLTVIALSNAKLINLVSTYGTLTPSFNSDNFSYNAQVDNEIQGVRLTLTFDPTATATINGSSAPNDRQSFFIPLNVGNNTINIIVTAQDHITKNTYTLVVYRGEDQKSIVASNILTPNGDGKNDTWVIADIQLFPNNTVTVFDKAGRTVYTKHGYTNDWNGTYGGAPLTEGTYYYIVDLGPQKRQFKGFITIIHDR
ncbi:T9SS type B sorting domain-containing protein [Mucilaginibacter sp. HC2]|uniref:MBG domain-containing protein n=1 Tax=Mucilaginibacter inviolabilis TaxID=2714892 RepID=UPI00140BA231|nr:MBG domain-containing protein [Mucilaginibacter inviolabilis]NHA07849.1 T9SS type B sorting domain-containing protein [Mucilaginibacter inviolabilis]